jgi:hypothetical protein
MIDVAQIGLITGGITLATILIKTFAKNFCPFSRKPSFPRGSRNWIDFAVDAQMWLGTE